MVKMLRTNELWMVVELLLAPEPPKPKGDKPRIEVRTVLAGIPRASQKDIDTEAGRDSRGFKSRPFEVRLS
jgi:hypothetical protein